MVLFFTYGLVGAQFQDTNLETSGDLVFGRGPGFRPTTFQTGSKDSEREFREPKEGKFLGLLIESLGRSQRGLIGTQTDEFVRLQTNRLPRVFEGLEGDRNSRLQTGNLLSSPGGLREVRRGGFGELLIRSFENLHRGSHKDEFDNKQGDNFVEGFQEINQHFEQPRFGVQTFGQWFKGQNTHNLTYIFKNITRNPDENTSPERSKRQIVNGFLDRFRPIGGGFNGYTQGMMRSTLLNQGLHNGFVNYNSVPDSFSTNYLNSTYHPLNIPYNVPYLSQVTQNGLPSLSQPEDHLRPPSPQYEVAPPISDGRLSHRKAEHGGLPLVEYDVPTNYGSSPPPHYGSQLYSTTHSPPFLYSEYASNQPPHYGSPPPSSTNYDLSSASSTTYEPTSLPTGHGSLPMPNESPPPPATPYEPSPPLPRTYGSYPQPYKPLQYVPPTPQYRILQPPTTRYGPQYHPPGSEAPPQYGSPPIHYETPQPPTTLYGRPIPPLTEYGRPLPIEESEPALQQKVNSQEGKTEVLSPTPHIACIPPISEAMNSQEIANTVAVAPFLEVDNAERALLDPSVSTTSSSKGIEISFLPLDVPVQYHHRGSPYVSLKVNYSPIIHTNAVSSSSSTSPSLPVPLHVEEPQHTNSPTIIFPPLPLEGEIDRGFQPSPLFPNL